MTFESISEITLIAGQAHPELARSISEELGIPLANAHVGRFPDGEIDIKVDEDIRGRDVFVLQPLCPPVNGTGSSCCSCSTPCAAPPRVVSPP